jgi:hypothetical protein
MESFVWNECFVTGLPKVDEQHQRLVELINGFGEGLMEEPGRLAAPAGSRVCRTGRLRARSLPRRRSADGPAPPGCTLPGAPPARAPPFPAGSDPAASAAWQVQTRPPPRTLQQFLVDWLAYHILGSDQDLARQIDAIDAGISPDEAFRTRRHARDPATSILLQSLDRLFHHVSERNRELMAWNQTLEARVAERTRELSLANQRLEQQAMTDVLTGLANRRHAMQCLQADWPFKRTRAQPGLRHGGCRRPEGRERRHGHGAGDEVLRQVARALRARCATTTPCAAWAVTSTS